MTDGPLTRRPWSLPVAVVGVVRVAAAGLRQAAGHHVANGEDRGVQPDLARTVAAGVGRVDDRASDEDAGEDGEVGEELCRLERGLRLGAQTADAVARRDGARVVLGRAEARGCGGAHEVLLDL